MSLRAGNAGTVEVDVEGNYGKFRQGLEKEGRMGAIIVTNNGGLLANASITGHDRGDVPGRQAGKGRRIGDVIIGDGEETWTGGPIKVRGNLPLLRRTIPLNGKHLTENAIVALQAGNEPFVLIGGGREHNVENLQRRTPYRQSVGQLSQPIPGPGPRAKLLHGAFVDIDNHDTAFGIGARSQAPHPITGPLFENVNRPRQPYEQEQPDYQ